MAMIRKSVSFLLCFFPFSLFLMNNNFQWMASLSLFSPSM
jgi:hypothetical protein